jgi:predicted nucleic acid-binding protein
VTVVDASTVVELLLDRPRAQVVRRHLVQAVGLAAPALLDAEVLLALRTWVRRDRLEAPRGSRAVEDLMALPIQRVPLGSLAPRIWELRDNLSAYDACYVALAEALDAELLTCDGRLARAPHRARVTVIA